MGEGTLRYPAIAESARGIHSPVAVGKAAPVNKARMQRANAKMGRS